MAAAGDVVIQKPKHTLRNLLLGVVGLVVCLCAGCFAVIQYGENTPEFKATKTAEAALAATQLVQRSWTATPSVTPTATNTPGPTAMPTATATATDTETPLATLPPKTATAFAQSVAATITAAVRLASIAESATTKAISAAAAAATQTQAAAGTATAVASSAGASQWIVYQNRQVGVTKIEWDQALGYFRAESGKVLLSLYIVAKNNGTNERIFTPSDFGVIDGGGQVNGKVFGPEKEPVFNDCTIQQGGACEGWWTTQIFDRPTVRAKLILRWSPGLFDSSQETAITVQ